MDLIIRKATIQDLDNIINNRMEFLTDIKGKEPSDDFREATRNYLYKHIQDDTLLCHIATHQEQIVSIVVTCFFQVLPKSLNITGKIGYVFNVYTIKEYRGQGLAKKLMQTMISEAKQLGIGELYLSATEAGKILYEKLGFQHLNDEMSLNLLQM